MYFLMTLMFAQLSLANGPSIERTEWYLPINVVNRQSLEHVRLTAIGEFGRPRQARANVPAHLHTAIDLMRPHNNYVDEPIFPAAVGTVISLRSDGPFAQVIIEHREADEAIAWTVYEHIAGIQVSIGALVSPFYPIGRFFNHYELDKFGWQFNHLHFEILKEQPRRLEPEARNPLRFYQAYTLECFNQDDLEKYYHHPLEVFESRWQAWKPKAGEKTERLYQLEGR
jgi:hypothetical protein